MQNLLDDILEFITIASRALLKVLSGFIIVPLGITVDQLKPGWEEASRSVKFFTGIVLVPITAFLYFAAPWWDDFDVVD
jgi:uncharacterized membrane protein